jgi:hypothetical protein
MPATKAEWDSLQEVSVKISAENIKLFNVIIMTQSCDFTKNKSDEDLITLCPRFDFQEVYVGKEKDRWKPLIEGRIVGAHLLNRCELSGFNFEYQVVDLTQIFSIPYSFLKKVSQAQKPRIGLLPPYREHLAQAFARRFMRVGLPIDLPRDYPYK